MEQQNYHVPVLLLDSVNGLNIDPDGVYVDVTFGGGGHSREILTKLKEGRLFGFDQDPDAANNTPDDPRFTLIPQNFRYMANFLRMYGVNEVNGILADLGVSSHQFDVPDRGFSIRFDAPLDMRMSQNGERTAATILNTSSPEDLRRILQQYGEVRGAGRVVQRILEFREEQPFETTGDLIKVLSPLVPPLKQHKFQAQVFQALRIEVNDELGALKELLKQSERILKPGGRLSIISYHSLEDRMVKRFLRAGNFEGEVKKDFYGNPITPFKLITRSAITATEEEVNQNSRARSARLRIAERL